MNVALTGASGFIGQALIERASRMGFQFVGFSRRPERAIAGCDEVRRFSLEAVPDLRGCDAVVHLAGEPIFGVWTPGKKRAIAESRILGTRRVVEAIAALERKPEVFVCGSAVGIYADGGERELGEGAPRGDGFLAETVAAWEAEAMRASGTRVVLLRTAMVLGKKGGALKFMRPIFRAWLGARVGDGRQWMPWIHLEDEVRLILFALQNLEVSGPLNAAAPWPVRHGDFTRELARALRRPAPWRVPAWVARAALGAAGAELLASKRVVPEAATTAGFGFSFPELAPALRDVCG